MSKKDIEELVKDPEWIKIRQSLVGQWKSRPTWCCGQLRKYLGSLSSTHNNKLKIVMNYLTGSGFRMGKIKHECITNLRTQISMQIKVRKAKKEWD